MGRFAAHSLSTRTAGERRQPPQHQHQQRLHVGDGGDSSEGATLDRRAATRSDDVGNAVDGVNDAGDAGDAGGGNLMMPHMPLARHVNGGQWGQHRSGGSLEEEKGATSVGARRLAQMGGGGEISAPTAEVELLRSEIRAVAVGQGYPPLDVSCSSSRSERNERGGDGDDSGDVTAGTKTRGSMTPLLTVQLQVPPHRFPEYAASGGICRKDTSSLCLEVPRLFRHLRMRRWSPTLATFLTTANIRLCSLPPRESMSSVCVFGHVSSPLLVQALLSLLYPFWYRCNHILPTTKLHLLLPSSLTSNTSCCLCRRARSCSSFGHALLWLYPEFCIGVGT